jgi:long-subunit acyl-CoA synthetase (AMP-forming)
VFYARPDALKGSLNQTMKHAKPTIFMGVPRIWEKMEEKIASIPQGFMIKWALKTGLKYTNAKFNNESTSGLKYWIADSLVLKKIRQELGLDEVNLSYSGAAPIFKKTLELIMSLGIPICETYGMSESAGKAVSN